MRSSWSRRRVFSYTTLLILFVFSLHHNGVFDSFGNTVFPAVDSTYLQADDILLRNSKEFRLSHEKEERYEKEERCEPKQKIVFVKTHKTASSTATAIIERYGFNRNFTFAVSNTALKFSAGAVFDRRMVKETSGPVIGWRKEDGYHMLTNHARFNKAEMDAVVHNATYITIVRNPVNQLESAFGYFNLGVTMGFDKTHQLEEFMKDPARHFGVRKRGYWQFAKNNQLFDLGVDHAYHDDPDVLRATIDRLDSQFDLVMVSDYFDESLVLLRRLLCWDVDDMIYISKSIRSASHRLEMSEELQHKIQAWNQADMQLYQRSNATLWRKIRNYGPEFQTDLEAFRTKLRMVSEDCINPTKMNRGDKREDKFVLKTRAPPYCQEILMGDVEYTRIIQRKMWDRGILLPNPKLKS